MFAAAFGERVGMHAEAAYGSPRGKPREAATDRLGTAALRNSGS